MTPSDTKALDGIKVVDAASLFAGPVIASFLGDYGAEVTKIEHPSVLDGFKYLEKRGVAVSY